MKIKIIDIGWAAGFLEGEGYFGISTTPGSARVVVTQVQREPLERLKRIFNVGNICNRIEQNKNAQLTFVWRVNGQRAIEVMMTVFTLMSPRRKEKIETVIRSWKGAKPRNKFSKGHSYFNGRWKKNEAKNS